MCYGNPTKSLELAQARMTPEAWARFEADFEHFVAYSGLGDAGCFAGQEPHLLSYAWAKWAFLQGAGRAALGEQLRPSTDILSRLPATDAPRIPGDSQWVPDEEAYRIHLRPRHTVSASMKVLGFIAVICGWLLAAIGLLKAIQHFFH
jgi:hypothetical protein